MSRSGSAEGTLAARLRLAREQAGLSQGQVAKMLGLHRPSVSEMEAGRRRVTADELAELAKIYAVSIEWLSGQDECVDGKGSARIELAARELAKLSDDDLDRLLQLLSTLRVQRSDG